MSIFGQNIYDYILITSRHENPQIISLVEISSIHENITIFKSLGIRNDPYTEDIIAYLMSFSTDSEIKGLYLEIYFEAMFSQDNYSAYIHNWVEINPLGFNLVFHNLKNFRNYHLKALVIRLAQFTDREDVVAYVISESQKIISKMQEGTFDYSIYREIAAILEVAVSKKDRDFIPFCYQVIRYANRKEVVDMTRQVIKYLMTGS